MVSTGQVAVAVAVIATPARGVTYNGAAWIDGVPETAGRQAGLGKASPSP